MIFKCPRCGSPIVNEYFDTSGQHWHCNNCERNSHSYTLVYDDYTHQLQELSDYVGNKTNMKGGEVIRNDRRYKYLFGCV